VSRPKVPETPRENAVSLLSENTWIFGPFIDAPRKYFDVFTMREILANDVERVLADIDADYGGRSVEFLSHGVLSLSSVTLASISLAGREHGRTIPLADFKESRPVVPARNPVCCTWVTDLFVKFCMLKERHILDSENVGVFR
jgi:hypothetical protein